jgi:hypothetical protein
MITKKIVSIFSFCLATLVAFLPFNYIVGSKIALFSYSSMAMPELGFQYSLVYLILYFFTKSLFTFASPFLFLLHRLPLFFATIALKKSAAAIFVGVPLGAMLLFCAHPVGSQVFYYSWYWFIPMIIYFFVQDSLISRALAASFIAHAVGSVVWLYTGHIPAEIWTALMPLVIVERLLIAFGMVGFIALFKLINSFCESKVVA